jgi:alpha-tubulin suppressor-like RCC1 family protein
MTIRRTRRVVVAAMSALGVALAMAFGGCDGPERDSLPRYDFPVDAPEEDAPVAIEADVPRDAMPPDARTDAADAALDADADAGPIVVRAIATGSGEHPDALVGNGDHTCVIAGPTRSLYCWGANDHGQIGNGKTGAATFAEDVPSATKIALDETGLAFDGLEEISLAAWHSCARTHDLLFCWGQRFSGAQAEPPSATELDRTAPRAIGNFDVARVAAGGPHTCALKTNGKIACFGHSAFNELGRANAADPVCSAPIFYDYHASPNHQCAGTLVEVMFGALAKTTSVVSGEVHSCALADGKVQCWGATASGEVGRPGLGASELNAQIVVTDPTLLTPLDGVTALASDGAKHTCALRANGVVCWGLNDVGQLGADPATVPLRAFAGAPVAATAGAVAIGVAERVTCAVKSDATVVCWGSDLAALGDGGTASSFVPAPVRGPAGVGLLTGVAAIAPGARHACALKTDGTVWCWGKNDRGQLGDGTKVDSAFPVKVVGLP